MKTEISTNGHVTVHMGTGTVKYTGNQVTNADTPIINLHEKRPIFTHETKIQCEF